MQQYVSRNIIKRAFMLAAVLGISLYKASLSNTTCNFTGLLTTAWVIYLVDMDLVLNPYRCAGPIE